MNAEHNLNFIDLYLRKELNKEDLILFEEKLRSDPWFLREVEQQRKIIQAIKETEILNILGETHREITEEKKVNAHRYSEPEDTEELIYAMKSVSNFPLEMKAYGLHARQRSNPIAIAYEGDPNPPFRIKVSSGKSLFEHIHILPESGPVTFHYRLIFAPGIAVLSLFGNFNPNRLTLIYHKQNEQDIFRLRIDAKEYQLNMTNTTSPLSE